jgi:hypothetical protein
MVKLTYAIERIPQFCQRWKISELALFGSALREDFRPDSDVDLLVAFAPGARWGLREWSQMEEELEQIFGRPVDLVSRAAVERSPNYIRRRHILSTLERVYVA